MHDFLKFLLLFGCVPAQLLLSEWLAPADLGSSRDIASGGHGYGECSGLRSIPLEPHVVPLRLLFVIHASHPLRYSRQGL